MYVDGRMRPFVDSRKHEGTVLERYLKFICRKERRDFCHRRESRDFREFTGTWMYVNPALQLEGDNALKNVAGSLAATEAEKKMKEYCAKVGIVEGVFNYVFNSDSTFTSALKRGSLKGTYSVSPEDKTVTLRYTVGNKKLTVSTLTAHVVLSGNELTLLFNADKLLKFLSTVSSISSNTTLKAINKLASEYDGMMLGFDLKK